MGSGGSKKKSTKPAPAPTKPQQHNKKPVVDVTEATGQAHTNQAGMTTPTVSHEGKLNSTRDRKTSVVPSEDPHNTPSGNLSWRTVNMAALLQQNPDAPWWDTAKLLRPPSDVIIEPDSKRRGWKTIRLFVSSTFKDMHSEREYLVKKIFPRLREWCEGRRLRLVECDLRWGVPKDASTRQTLLTCLSEIDRCYEENEFPYFLGMLSERYGWIPQPDEVPPDIKHRYKWIPGMSVTSLEMLTGNWWSKNPNAICMLRSPDFLSSIASSTVKSSYCEKDETAQHSLTKLKELLQSAAGAKFHTYTCQVVKEEERRAILDGLELFGEQVMDHFQQAIERQYPPLSVGSELSNQELMHIQHEAFMTQRSALLLGRDDIMDEIRRYVNNQMTSAKPLVVIGYPGAGKSAVLASVAKELTVENRFTVFYHFVGATPGSTALSTLLTRLWLQLMPGSDKVPVDYSELKRSMTTVIGKSGAAAKYSGKAGVVIVIDALNQLDEEDDVHNLGWLPRKLPDNVRVIISTLEGPCLQALRQGESKLPEVTVGPLGENARRQIVQQVLSEYTKILDEEQLETLVEKTDAGRPLYLTVACEELRVFGEFRKLTEKVKNLAADMAGLLAQMLERVALENGGDLVIATLCLIESSRFGLLENELIDLLGITTRLPKDGAADLPATRDRLPMAEWAYVFVGLRQFLRPAGSSAEGRLDFYHRTISKVVRTRYLTNDNDAIWWHRRLANHFMTVGDAERRAEELPHQLRQLEDKERLERVLLEESMFESMYTPENLQELRSLWQYLGGFEKAASCHMATLNPELKGDTSTLKTALAKKTKLGLFMTDIGQYEQAEALFTEVIQCTTDKFGAESVLLCQPLSAIVDMFYMRALTVVYGSHPLYKHCKQKGTHFSQICAKVHKRHLAADDVSLGRVLAKCGYFISSLLEDASAICRERSLQDYAEILYMQGEKHQYEQDIAIPEKLFRQSYDLCRSHFGPVHLKTARCNQLWGQLYWNQYVTYHERQSWMQNALRLYSEELSILEEILGTDHPNTVRSREDVIIILQTLGRHSEADDFLAKQPANAAAT